MIVDPRSFDPEILELIGRPGASCFFCATRFTPEEKTIVWMGYAPANIFFHQPCAQQFLTRLTLDIYHFEKEAEPAYYQEQVDKLVRRNRL